MPSRSLPAFQAVILDMDGLAIDTETGFFAAWKQAAAEFGMTLAPSLEARLSGRQASEVEAVLQKAIGTGFDLNRFRRLAADYWRESVEANGIPAMPGLHVLLDWLASRSIPYALATNSSAANAQECLRLSGLSSRFQRVLTRDQVMFGKPHPDLLLEAARCLGYSPGECLVLEDSAVGLLAACRAGALPVLVNARADDELQRLAPWSFRSLSEVAEAMRTGGFLDMA